MFICPRIPQTTPKMALFGFRVQNYYIKLTKDVSLTKKNEKSAFFKEKVGILKPS